MSASRPTWNPATGSSMAPTLQYSNRDLNGHTRLKLRQSLDQKKSQQTPRSSSNATSFSLDLAEDDEDLSFGQKERDPKDLATSLECTFEETDSGNEKAGSNEEEQDEEDEEDDTEALLRELEKIKKERELAKLRQEREEQETKSQHAIIGNPLLLPENQAFSVKRRWDDDVVFKNQAKGVEERPKKRFINDTLRSDFHRKFLDRYIK